MGNDYDRIRRILEDDSIPLSTRRDEFNKYIVSKKNATPAMIAKQLKLTPQRAEFYYSLNSLEKPELSKLEGLGFEPSIYSFILHYDEDLRAKIYENTEKIKKSKRPFYTIREITEAKVDVSELVKSLSSKFLWERREYIKQVSSGSRSYWSFCGLLAAMAKFSGSPKQIDWFLRELEDDFSKSKGFFYYDTLEHDFPEDFVILDRIAFILSFKKND